MRCIPGVKHTRPHPNGKAQSIVADHQHLVRRLRKKQINPPEERLSVLLKLIQLNLLMLGHLW
ncbi:MAG TPA: hypothetical protein VJY35_04470 [Candidatus Eisenbacteria bacterium]|nr:hypothetical protein [Candidatus Eisenbacteria bacterium]